MGRYERLILTGLVALALLCWLPKTSCARSGSIWADYPANNALINKQSGSFDAGIGFNINGPYTGIIQPGSYCGPGYPASNPDPQWYGRIEQLDYYSDAYPGYVLVNLKYRLDGGASTSIADIRMGDNQDKIATINVASLTTGSHTAAFDAYGIYAERCAYPSSCTTCHGNTYVSSPWVRKEGGLFAQASLNFRVMSPVAGAPTPLLPAHRTFVAPSWIGSDSVSFIWSSVANASKYLLNITDGGGLSISRETGATSFSTSSDSSIVLQRAHKYSWTVAAGNELGYGTPSPAKTFIIGEADCWPEIGNGTGQSHIDTCYDLNSNPEIYRLKDISRRTSMDTDGHKGAMGTDKAITTMAGSATAGELTNSSNSWTAVGTQKKAIDAQVNSGKVYDYLLDPLLNPLLDMISTPRRFSRNSFDGNGASMVSVVENPTVQCGAESACFFENTVYYTPGSTDSGEIDIVTHEWGHGVTATSSLLGNWNEPGALDEAFSDWLAIAHKQARGSTSWEVIQGGGSVLRDVRNPSNSGQPVIYQKNSSWTNDYKYTTDWGSQGEIHKNAGVPNKMFYLLANGGSHYEVDVQGVGGISRAMQIAFRANSIGYWSSIFSLSEAKTKMVQAAQDLSATPNEINQIKLAWAAVGVGDLPRTTTSIAGLLAGSTVAYRENAKLRPCTAADAACIAAKRYQFSCSCISESYYSPWDKRVTVEATPNLGYYFQNWTEDGNTNPISSSSVYTFNVTGDRTLVANFSATAPAVSASYSGDFQSVVASASSPDHTFTVTNSGTQTISISPVQLAGANPADFIITANGCSGLNLSPAASCTIKARFSPASTGAKTASLIIPSTGSTTPSYAIALSGLSGWPVMMGAAGSLEGDNYFTFQAAYNNVDTGNEIKLMATNFNETLNFNRPVSVAVRGGYDGNFADRSGKSVLQGSLTISRGTVIVDGLQIGGSSYHSGLTVNVDNPASGTITSNPAGINCTDSCSSSFVTGDAVTLTASPVGDSVFTGWSGGGCSGSGSCTVTMTGNMAVTAHFSAAKITVAPASESMGTVYIGTSSSTQTITVTSSGTHDLIVGTLSLSGSDSTEFAKTGDTCSGNTLAPGATCSVQVSFTPSSTGAKTVSLLIPSNDPQTPVFSVSLNGIGKYPTLTVSKSGAGAGTVTGSSGGISCGSSCTGTFALNTEVTLTATPGFGYIFTGWSGACSGTDSCNLTMDSDKIVAASFDDMPIASCSANPVMVNGTLYPSIQAAYNAAPDGSTIKLLATDIYESFTANRGIAVTVDGGYKCNFSTSSGTTVIHGAPDIATGAVTLINVSINQ